MAKIAKLQKEVDGVLNTIYPSTITEAVINIKNSKSLKDELTDINNKIPTKTSDITNDSGYITKDVGNLTNYSTTNTVNQAINNAVSSKVDISSISTVATSGNYKDLNNKPIIPSKTSELTNDSNYITSSAVDTKISSAIASVYRVKGTVSNYSSLPKSNVTIGDVYNLSDTGANYVCTATSPITWDKLSETVDLSSYSTTAENDAKYQLKGNYITSIPAEYVTDTELEAKGYATAASVKTALATKLDSSAYKAATSTTSGYMSSKDYIKLSGIEENADVNIIEAITVNGNAVSVTNKTAAIEVNKYTHPKFTKRNKGLYKITVNDEGHVSDATAVTKDDITALGIPAKDTVYTHPSYTPREAGLYKVTVDSTGHVSNAAVVTKADITSLGIPAQDTVYTHPSYTSHSEGLYKITVNKLGHVSGVKAVAKADITALGIPAQDTTYSAGSGLSLSGTKINHASSITAGTAGSSNSTSGITIDIPYVTYNATGHITAAGTHSHTIDIATTSAPGLMPSLDRAKTKRLESYTTATTVANLNVDYQTIYVTLSENASLSVNGGGTAYNGRSITAYVYTSSSVTITIPTSGNYVSMCGSSFTTTAGGWVEFSLVCVKGVWHIAKLEQEQ